MNTFFKELFEYSHHSNQEIATTFINKTEETFERANALYCYLLNPHHIWNNRIMLIQPLHGVWDLLPLKNEQKLIMRTITIP